MAHPQHPDSTPSSFRSKLGSYCTGLAIGFILLGFFMYQKHRSEQRAQERIQMNEQTHTTPPAVPSP
ncbi:MAG: hypothetical protein P1U30_06885 [Phycisphaerales bacterium]|nr:hypothetical protein [Phycisphaerales bacterium]